MDSSERNAEPPAERPGKRGPRRPLEEQRNPRVRITVKSAELLRGMRKGDATDAEIIESALVACYVAGTFSAGTPQSLPGILEGLRESHRAEASTQVECLKQARLMTLFAQHLVIIEPLRKEIMEERDHRKALMDPPPNARPLRLGGAQKSTPPPAAPAAQEKDVPETGASGLEAELGGLAPMVALKLRVMAEAFGISVDDLRLLLLHVATEEYLRLGLPAERIRNSEGFYSMWRMKSKRESEVLGLAEEAVGTSAMTRRSSPTALEELIRATRALGARLENLLGNK